MRGNRAAFAGVLTILLIHAATARAAEERPTIGLVLGGGSARGLAHIGVLQWFEEHRVPIDAIAGTSMGALVAGGYATGRSADELRTLVTALDWDRLFLGDVPFDLKSFRRKEDRRRYQVRFELGLRDGLGAASGLDSGHQIGLFLSRVAFPYASPLGFDDLPIPFRAVATDLEQAEIVVLERGSLSRALRATMAIPGLFVPVVIDGRLLADGGLLNNVPVDVVRALGVDRVIAVDVGAALETRDELRSALQLASQALNVMMAERSRQRLQDADVVVRPATDDMASTDWRWAAELIERGYAGAAAVRDDLEPYALSPEAWRRHLDDRQARRVASAPTPRYIDVQGISGAGVETIHARLAPHLNQPLDLDALDRDLTRLAGTGRYESLMYEVAEDAGQAGLWVDVADKAHGPPFVNVSLELVNQADALSVSFGGRVTFYDVGPNAAEARVDLELGSTLGAAFEHFQPLGETPFFVAGRAVYGRRAATSSMARLALSATAPSALGSAAILASPSAAPASFGLATTRLEWRRPCGSAIRSCHRSTDRSSALGCAGSTTGTTTGWCRAAAFSR